MPQDTRSITRSLSQRDKKKCARSLEWHSPYWPRSLGVQRPQRKRDSMQRLPLCWTSWWTVLSRWFNWKVVLPTASKRPHPDTDRGVPVDLVVIVFVLAPTGWETADACGNPRCHIWWKTTFFFRVNSDFDTIEVPDSTRVRFSSKHELSIKNGSTSFDSSTLGCSRLGCSRLCYDSKRELSLF